jgi:uncharacterized protein YecE (DUF72 family)
LSHIHVGTSGFSYADWKGVFYPPKLNPRDFLAYYARHFDTCELNFTYYRMPDARTLARMVERSDGRVEFTAKAFQAMTHARDATPEVVSAFVEALAPLREARVFGGLLLQFPFSFKREASSETYAARLADLLRAGWPEIPLVMEFRHRSWISDETFAWMRAQRLGLCCVDEPRIGNLMPPVAVATGPIAYVRFHGRNAAKWWKHERPEERYDYRYSDEELAEWVPRVHALAVASQKTFVFFNNHFRAKAVVNAKRLLELLAGDAPPGEKDAA